MTVNEMKFVDLIVSQDEKISEAQQYINENYGIDSEYNQETNTIHLFTNDIKKTGQLNKAKSYLKDIFDESLINIEFGK